MAAAGRRTLYLTGLAIMVALLFGIGIVGTLGLKASTGGWAAGTLLLLYILVYDLTVGPVGYALVADMPSARMRTKTVVLARMSYNVLGIAANTLTPYMLNTDEWNWGAKVGWFWGVACMGCFCYCWWRLPEPKGRTVEEMDVLFEKGVGARGFKRAKVNVGSGEVQK